MSQKKKKNIYQIIITQHHVVFMIRILYPQHKEFILLLCKKKEKNEFIFVINIMKKYLINKQFVRFINKIRY